MSLTIKKNLLLLKEDYDTLVAYTRTRRGVLSAGLLPAGWLYDALADARVVDEDLFPIEVVRLRSTAILRDTVARHLYTYTVVLPEEADHRKGKVSVLSPIGAALFSARKGDNICWQPPAAGRWFTILTVKQPWK